MKANYKNKIDRKKQRPVINKYPYQNFQAREVEEDYCGYMHGSGNVDEDTSVRDNNTDQITKEVFK